MGVLVFILVFTLEKRFKLYQWPDLYELKQNYSDRNTAIALAYQSGGYSMEKIGIFFGLHPSWVSRVIGDVEKAKNKTRPPLVFYNMV